MRKYLAFLFFCLTRFCLAQDTAWFSYSFPSLTPPAYTIQFKDELKKNLNEELPELSESEKRDYAETMGYAKYILMGNGNIYYNWTEVESYLNEILHRILPESLNTNPTFHVYVQRDASINASALHDGTFFINIGMLCELEDEAQIAMVLGHELAHYLKKHSKENFIKQSKGNDYLTRNFAKRITLLRNQEYSRSQEMTADSFGIVLANRAGYDPFAELEVTSVFENLEQESVIWTGEKRSEKFSSHPRPGVRKENEQEIISSLTKKETSRFLIKDKAFFERIRKMARQERFNLLLLRNELGELQKKALKMYLMDPGNPRNSYLVLESIRRILYFNPENEKKGYLTFGMKQWPFKKNQGIFNDLSYLIYNKKNLAQVSKVPPASVQTYKEAFEYFQEIALKQKFTETYLTLALYNYKSISKRNEFLTTYLSKSDAKFQKYAQALLTDKLETNYNKSMLIVYPISQTNNKYSGIYNNYAFYDQEATGHQARVEKALSKQRINREILFYAKDHETHPRDFAMADDMVQTLYNFSDEDILRVRFSYLAPEYWTYFNDKQIKNIEYEYFNSFTKPFGPWRHIFLLPPATFVYLYHQIVKLVGTGHIDKGYWIESNYVTLNMSETYANVYSIERNNAKKINGSSIASITKKMVRDSDHMKHRKYVKLKKVRKNE